VIEPTDEMEDAMVYGGSTRERLAAVLAIVERDYDVAERVQTRCDAGGPRWAHCQRGPEHPGQHAHSGPDGLVKW
jgi:hypothetical protein